MSPRLRLTTNIVISVLTSASIVPLWIALRIFLVVACAFEDDLYKARMAAGEPAPHFVGIRMSIVMLDTWVVCVLVLAVFWSYILLQRTQK